VKSERGRRETLEGGRREKEEGGIKGASRCEERFVEIICVEYI